MHTKRPLFYLHQTQVSIQWRSWLCCSFPIVVSWLFSCYVVFQLLCVFTSMHISLSSPSWWIRSWSLYLMILSWLLFAHFPFCGFLWLGKAGEYVTDQRYVTLQIGNSRYSISGIKQNPLVRDGPKISVLKFRVFSQIAR